MNSKEGEPVDDELDSVAGGKKCGTIYSAGRPMVTVANSYEHYIYKNPENTEEKSVFPAIGVKMLAVLCTVLVRKDITAGL